MERLREKLNQIDGKGYKAYKDIQGTYKGDGFLLHIDYVQPDPFAPPSRLRMEIPGSIIRLKDEWYFTDCRKTALEDFLAREISHRISMYGRGRTGTGKSGLIMIDTPSQEILKRTAVKVDKQRVEIRLSAGLPAAGRTVLGKLASGLLCSDIPEIVKRSMFEFSKEQLEEQLMLCDNQQYIRKYIDDNRYICFIANSSILPRESGISDRPLKSQNVVPFESPKSLEVEIPLPHGKPIKGMAIPYGVTLIVGGGYHGKSTLLKAIERGVYDHIKGDGREYVITNARAFKVRAEDGRSVEKVNISPFISNLPLNKDTTKFTTEDASGSTSQAANIMEALEAGCSTFLIDEDTSATNFMVRDARMQELVSKDKEPITPFIDKVRLLYKDFGVSTILVLGGSGDYFDVADIVIMMDEYKPQDVTKEAREVSVRIKNTRKQEGGERFGEVTHRIVKRHIPDNPRDGADAKGLSTIIYGKTKVDLSFVEQLVDQSQTRSIALMMEYILSRLSDDNTPLSQLLDKLYGLIYEKGLEVISPYNGKHPGDLAMPRRLEVSAALNRLRTLRVK